MGTAVQPYIIAETPTKEYVVEYRRSAHPRGYYLITRPKAGGPPTQVRPVLSAHRASNAQRTQAVGMARALV